MALRGHAGVSRRAVVAVVSVTVAAVLVLSPAPPTAGSAPEPVEPQVQTVPLEETADPGSDVVAEATADVGHFAVVGVTWERGADLPDVAVVEARTRVDGSWSGWTEMHHDDAHGPDPVSPEAVGSRPGTEPLVVGDVDEVEIRVLAAEGEVPESARVDVVDPSESPADGLVGTVRPGEATAAAARPGILTRAEWGADESIRGAPSYGSVRGGFVHHTVNANTYAPEDVPAIMRGIYAYHVRTRGWKDIGYNFLVDRFGRIWEGRYGGIDLPVIGAHTAGYNDDAFAMSAIGDFTSVSPSDAVLDAYGRLFAWKLSLHGVDPTGTVSLDGTSFRTVSGHRDAAATACPGQRLYDRLPTIRSLAKGHQASFASRDPQRAAGGSGAPSLVGLDATGSRVIHSAGDGGSGFLASRQVGTGWAGLVPTGVGDWDGDRRSDLLVTDPVSGTLWLYAGDGRGGWLSRRAVGSGWEAMRLLTGPGDVTGDGRRDLLAVDGAGALWLYPGNGTGGFLARRLVGPGWQVMDVLVGPGDWDGDGRADLLARQAGTGELWLYPGNGAGGFTARRQVGSRWDVMASVVGPGDWDGDGRRDLLAFGADGVVWLYPRTASGGFDARVRVGWGWAGMDAVLGVGDWGGDGPADIMARVRADGRLILYQGSGGRRFAPGTAAAPPGPTAGTAALVGDWDGDRRPDVLGRAASGGALYLWRGTGGGTFSAPTPVGSGWQGFASLTAAGDWDGDGRPDLLAFDRSAGVVWQYRADGGGGFLPRRRVGSGLARFDTVVAVGRWDGDGAPDLLAREASTGALHLLPGNGPGGLLAGRVVGTGWQVMGALVGVGDADGDGHADLVARERSSGRLWLYPGTGKGGFGSRSALGPEWSSWLTLG